MLRSLIYNPRLRHRLVVIGALLALIIVAGLSLLAQVYTVLPVDVWFTRELQEHQWTLISRLMYAVSFFGYTPWSTISVALGTLLVGIFVGRREGGYLLAITVGQGLVNALIKRTIGRPRPIADLVDIFVPEHGFSFPSGHVMFYTVFFGFCLFLVLTRVTRIWLRRLLGLPLGVLVLLIGPARIILGAHWLSDVLAAYLLSLVILTLAVEGYYRYIAPSAPATKRW